MQKVCIILPSRSRKDSKMRRQLLFILIPVLALALSACSGKRVFFEYEDEKFGSANIQITMPGGEHFMGKLLEEPMGPQADQGYTNIDEFPGNAEALLYGDRGTEMRCKFRLSDKMMGFKSGGYGLCETSKGDVIDIFTR